MPDVRPPAAALSALRAPLDRILGTAASVRVLRVLTQLDTPLAGSEVARRARLNPSGTRRTISALIDLGILEFVGAGPRQLVRLRRQHPLAAMLTELFAAEAERFDSLIASLQSALARLRPPPRAAWVQGPVATGDDEPGDPIVLGLLTTTKRLADALAELEVELAALETTFDVTISVRGWTSAELSTLPDDELAQLDEVLPLLGPAPMLLGAGETPSARPARTHRDHDRRALALARAVADRLSRDPTLIERARKHIARRIERASPGEHSDLREWDRLLRTMTLPRLQRFLVDPGERATRLRQSLPFLDVLSEEERKRIVEEADS